MAGDARELPPSSRPVAPPRAPAAAVRRIQSRDLLGAGAEVEIEHAGHVYRLRLTSLGKLILTK